MDSKYCLVVAELESQGLEERKRAKVANYIVPYGSADFEGDNRPDVTGEQELAEARGMSHVNSAIYMQGTRRAFVHHANAILRPSQQRIADYMEG